MARCPHCRRILSDEWLKHNGASALGRAGGKSKTRTNAREAAKARWQKKVDKPLD